MSLFETVLGAAVSTDVFKSATSYVITGTSEKIKEGLTKVSDTLGIDSNITKIGASLPSVAELTSASFRGGTSELTNNPFIEIQKGLMKTEYDKMSASEVKSATGSGDTDSDDHLVKLTDIENRSISFKVMPEIVESRTVQYDAVQVVQSPSAFQKYKGTDSTVWTVNATLISRNTKEATENLNIINTLRGWTMPYFGDQITSSNSGGNANRLGAPPSVLTFSGLRERVIGPVPVVITSLNWNWPIDTDYLPTEYIAGELDGTGSGLPVPFPAIMVVAITLTESFSTNQLNNFSLTDFRSGLMVAAFNSKVQQ